MHTMTQQFDSSADVIADEAKSGSESKGDGKFAAPVALRRKSEPEVRPDVAARGGLETAGCLATAATVSAALAACGGGGVGDAGSAASVATGTTSAAGTLAVDGVAKAGGSGDQSPAGKPAAATARRELAAEQVRFLLQAQFAATPRDLSALSGLSYAAWLDKQFNTPRSEGGYDWIISSGNADPFKGEFFFPDSADSMIWKQLIASPDQVRMRLALALSEVFVVSTNVMDAFWPGSFMGAYWDVLTKNAFGNFRALLEDVTLNPAMGRYLNMLGSIKEDPATGRLPDENFAREVMQLFTIGLSQLNLNGTPKLDSQGKSIDTYTQSDVSNLARVFTGYDYDYSGVTNTLTPFQTYPVPSTQYARARMAFDASKHSDLAATFLGVTVPARTPGPVALKTALDTLFNHPNVGPYFAKQMIQRLVTSNPSPAFVQRVASAFNNNGAGVRGDMKAFWKAILLDPEARALPSAATAGKVREPMIRAVQWARTFGATSVDGAWRVYDQSSSDYGLTQSPLRSASVFNFFRPGYVPPRTAIATAGLVAPEFQAHNESSTVGYLNYLADWVGGGFSNGAVKASYSELLPLAADSKALVQWVCLYLSADQLSDRTLKAIFSSVSSLPVTASSPDETKLQRIYAAVLLVMACPEYIVQK
jgi:uncharacterized protein (DUF1800 family)